MGSLSLLQQIFLTQELNLSLLHCRQILYHLSHQGTSYICKDPISQQGPVLRFWEDINFVETPFSSAHQALGGTAIVGKQDYCLLDGHFENVTNEMFDLRLLVEK